jgi:hypothetical protein
MDVLIAPIFSRPWRDSLVLALLTRQFLPGYFHSPMPGWTMFYRNGIAVPQKEVNTPESVHCNLKAFMS